MTSPPHCTAIVRGTISAVAREPTPRSISHFTVYRTGDLAARPPYQANMALRVTRRGRQTGVNMRVLLSTIGSRGEVQPVIALALQLQELGRRL